MAVASDESVLVVATQNPGKLREIQTYLRDLGWHLVLMPADLEIEETGETFLANACLKASRVAEVTGQWAIADDSGLAVTALGGSAGNFFCPLWQNRFSQDSAPAG